ncbi:MAG: hypothetical protein K0R26_1915 [Bacteroidota bacterium]|jgi:hypothetical protein|nr:hypothetical protein [Bacteroidota bacterium]
MIERFNKIFTIIGARGTGKTTIVKGDAKLKLRGLIDIYLKKGIKVLIVDTDDHPAYRDVPILTMESFKNFKTGVARILIDPEDINSFCRWFTDSNNHWNTFLIFEDARKHSEKSICKELNRLMGNSKQQNIDICFMYHSFGETPLDLYRKIDYIELCKTLDTPLVRKESLSACFDKVMKAFNTLQASTDRFKHITISTIDEIR